MSMAQASMANPAITKKLLENLNSDLHAMVNESKRKHPKVKEAAEAALLKIRTISTKGDKDIIPGLVSQSVDILHPFILGCNTKAPKIVHLSLIAIQRLISYEAISMPGANNIINTLWSLMESGVEELKLLQTAILLITTNTVVQHESLAKALVLCFRLYFTKDSTTINTAAATVRQLVTCVFERAVKEDSVQSQEPLPATNIEELKTADRKPPTSLRPCAQDAYMLFQDFCQLVNNHQRFWLLGLNEMTCTFGLELMESILTSFPSIFKKLDEFRFLLKERVCPLIIQLFSPSLKYRTGQVAQPAPTAADKPFFPVVMRLLRIVSVLIQKYYHQLVTECEIFLSLLVKFLDTEKTAWQRALALEVLSKLCCRKEHIRSFCESYDMKPHSTKIFQDIVNGLGGCIQSQFINPQTSSHSSTGVTKPSSEPLNSSPAMVAGLPVGAGVTPQPAFCYRGIWLPIVVNITQTQTTHRPLLLDQIERSEAPQMVEGYSLSLAFVCLLDTVRSVQTLCSEEPDESGKEEKDLSSQGKEVNRLHMELINSSWCGVMAAMTLLLDASTDETATEAILKAEQTYASLCGSLGMNTPRDAFITALCKASLPPHYTLTVLNSANSPPTQHKGTLGRTSSQEYSNSSMAGNSYAGNSQEIIHGSQVVAVGTALPTASLPLGAQQGPVMLTAKNIQCMRGILSVAHCHGGILGNSWHVVLTTLQHLVWILGLKPSSGGSLKVTQQASESPNAVITTAVMADLPVLSSMLSRLFESSQYLDDVALHHLIDALCKLSAEAMEMGFANREPSLFAVAKLLETGLVNLPRVQVLWKPVTNHLLEVCQHPHSSLRGWGAEAVTCLIKAAMDHKFEPPLHQQTKLQMMVLQPLGSLSSINHPDIRQAQLDCVLQLLQHNGENLQQAWPLVLTVIGAVTNNQGEALIRTAFQSLQLVVTDFLPIMPSYCLRICIEVAAKFGLQNQELNISLTAIGLMWNVSDHFYQHQEKIRSDIKDVTLEPIDMSPVHLPKPQPPRKNYKGEDIDPFDNLWLSLYSSLGELCIDSRPPVRKSAGQTLFSTIAVHGNLLQSDTWHTVLWQVLFPLLDNVKKLSSTASNDKEEKEGNILIHHTRDTAEKQWAETRVLSLAGVARIFNTKRPVLQKLGDFPRAWALLLELIEASALCRNAEVSLAALKSFQEILQLTQDENELGKATDLIFGNKKPGMMINAPGIETMKRDADLEPKVKENGVTEVVSSDVNADEDQALWSMAWKVWLNIGTVVTMPPPAGTPKSAAANMYIPSQAFLTASIRTFPALYAHIKTRFVAADLSKLFTVLQRSLAVPVHGDATPFIMPVGEVALTDLQEAVLAALQALVKEADSVSETLPSVYADLFKKLLIFVEYAIHAPKFGKMETKTAVVTNRTGQADWVAMNYVPFAEKVMMIVASLYKTTASQPSVMKEHVLKDIIKSLRLPLSLKYGCPSQSTWILAIDCLLLILNTGLPIARKNEAEFVEMWTELGLTFEEFLFSKTPAPANLSIEEHQAHEALDCKIVSLIRDDILPHSEPMPASFVTKIMDILNKGSIHSATTSAFLEIDSSQKLREDFARTCFETLLQFSFISGESGDVKNNASLSRIAVTSLLQRCESVLTKYVEDEKRSGRCPLPRPRMSEISFVLKAISTLLSSLQRAPLANVDKSIWNQVIGLYPALVECTTSTSPQVCKALRDALHLYKHMLAPPAGKITN